MSHWQVCFEMIVGQEADAYVHGSNEIAIHSTGNTHYDVIHQQLHQD